jgi:1-acyl-sn-glycerol-3-phosphate acyltransferase
MWVALRFIPCVLLRTGLSRWEARALWLQAGCRRVLRIFDVQIQVSGPIPSRGLLVSNHLSYLDILVVSALMPSLFVAKGEVKNWPIFGWFARLAGTLFAERERRTQVGPLTNQIRSALAQGALLVLFPEGTSSDGQTILPFKSALLAPATDASHPLSGSVIAYELEDGDVGEEICYWKDMTFGPHLLNLFSKRRVKAFVRFFEMDRGTSDRKELTRQLHSKLLKLKESRPRSRETRTLFPGRTEA